eukprot:754659-Hanusia_phi.AAC.1
MEWLLEHEGDEGIDEPMSGDELRSLARSRREVSNFTCELLVVTSAAGNERSFRRGEEIGKERRSLREDEAGGGYPAAGDGLL